jgi:hypothetical protein
MQSGTPVHYEGTTCSLWVQAPIPGVVVLIIEGHDVGEFGDEPMREVQKHLADGARTELFIDARHTKGASIAVSGEWALWLRANRDRFEQIHMLTGSRFVQITAGFVRTFSGLEDVMRVYTEADAFEEALGVALRGH